MKKHPKLARKQTAEQLGFSDSSVKRYRDEIYMKSPCNRIIIDRGKLSPRGFSVISSRVNGGTVKLETDDDDES